jgi:hypothetical protein
MLSQQTAVVSTMIPPFIPHYSLYPYSYIAPRYNEESFGVTNKGPLIDRLDGDLSKDEWAHVPWQSEAFDDIRGPNEAVPADERPPPGCGTQFKMMWDDQYLYIGVLLQSDNRTVATSFTKRNEPIFQQDSDFEVFLDPAASCHFYKELELNAWNTVWNLYLDKPCKFLIFLSLRCTCQTNPV